MLDLMELAATEKFRAKYLKSFRVVNVAHGIPYASVQYFDGATEQFQAPGGPGPLSFRAPISTIALAGPAIFLELGEIVMKSRAEAKRFGVQIDTSQAFSVLIEAPVRRKTAA